MFFHFCSALFVIKCTPEKTKKEAYCSKPCVIPEGLQFDVYCFELISLSLSFVLLKTMRPYFPLSFYLCIFPLAVQSDLPTIEGTFHGSCAAKVICTSYAEVSLLTGEVSALRIQMLLVHDNSL